MENNVKPGWKSTEFYGKLLAQLIGLSVLFGVFTPEQAEILTNSVEMIVGGLLTAAPEIAYAISRGLAKSKSDKIEVFNEADMMGLGEE